MNFTIYRVQAYQVPIVNPRWPPKIQDEHHEIFFFFLTFQHQTTVISSASSRPPCCLFSTFPDFQLIVLWLRLFTILIILAEMLFDSSFNVVFIRIPVNPNMQKYKLSGEFLNDIICLFFFNSIKYKLIQKRKKRRVFWALHYLFVIILFYFIKHVSVLDHFQFLINNCLKPNIIHLLPYSNHSLPK